MLIQSASLQGIRESNEDEHVIIENIAKKTTNKFDDSFVSAMEGPARFLPIVIGFFIASYYMSFSEESREIVDTINRTLITIFIFWVMHQIAPNQLEDVAEFFRTSKGLDGRTVQIDGWRDYDVVEDILKKCTPSKKKMFKVLKKSKIVK